MTRRWLSIVACLCLFVAGLGAIYVGLEWCDNLWARDLVVAAGCLFIVAGSAVAMLKR